MVLKIYKQEEYDRPRDDNNTISLHIRNFVATKDVRMMHPIETLLA